MTIKNMIIYKMRTTSNNISMLSIKTPVSILGDSKTSLGHLIPWVDGMMGRDSGVSCCGQV
jgi:hypothetical protein